MLCDMAVSALRGPKELMIIVQDYKEMNISRNHKHIVLTFYQCHLLGQDDIIIHFLEVSKLKLWELKESTKSLQLVCGLARIHPQSSQDQKPPYFHVSHFLN